MMNIIVFITYKQLYTVHTYMNDIVSLKSEWFFFEARARYQNMNRLGKGGGG